ncbi:MAG: acyltransferase [Hyphomicrobium sp.]|nr:acyltransferase [Hyphomicrobium sp.]
MIAVSLTSAVDSLDWRCAAIVAMLASVVCVHVVVNALLGRLIIAGPPAWPRLGCIDGLRGYLAICVLVHHFVIWTFLKAGSGWSPPPSNMFNNLGQAAVVVFFMITGALFYAKIIDRDSRFSWAQLYVSRIFRIVPLYWLVTTAVIAIVAFKSGGFPGDPGRNLLAIMKWLTFQGMPNLAGVQGSGRFVAYAPWTLAYEWLFYFSLPLLALVCGAARSLSMPTFAAPLVIATVGTIVSPIAFGGWRLSFVLPFALGMLAIELTRRPQVAGLLRMPAWAWIGVASLGLAMTQFPTAFESTPQIILFVFFLTVAAGNTYFGILSHPTSLVLGDASYSIYLLHGLVLSLFMGELLGPASGRPDTFIWVALPVLATVVCTVSIFTYHRLEAPAIASGKRFARGIQQATSLRPFAFKRAAGPARRSGQL